MEREVSELLKPVRALAIDAGEKILAIYQRADKPEVAIKPDGSPLTEADQVSNDCILAGLTKLTPDWPVLSEESTDVPFAERAAWERYWLVDPLDGTKEFLERTGDFTINIALIEGHRPVLGVVYVPVEGVSYYACSNVGAFKQSGKGEPQAISVRKCRAGSVNIVASRRHGSLTAFLQRVGTYELVQRGSSVKICLVAEGAADVYPRIGLTSEWDTAAAQCILEQAGGVMIDSQDGLPLQYNTRDALQNPYFLAVGDRTYDWRQYLK